MSDYKKLFSEIKKSPFIKKYLTSKGILEVYYTTQEDMAKSKPTLIRTTDKNGKGKELLYAASGKPVLEVNLRCGLPYGRAKMYDENGVQIFPNSYWYYGEEVTSVWALDMFRIYEDEEKQIPKEKTRARDKVYETDDFKTVLYGYAGIEGIQKPNFKLLAKMRRENMR